MPNIKDTKGRLRENLKDAGCSEELAEQFMKLALQGKEYEGLRLLDGHRKKLLDSCRAEQKKIDCLDYLVYQVEKNKKELKRLL